ncbi:MAG: DUF1569 domain-containing protein [Crocinitomicaceae bacterium]|nr:DUF1569 domain-containing protein [Crocinitomicaceae bacterium]
MGNILNKKDHEEIKNRLADLKRDDLPLWGKMNVGEMLCHTADQVKLAMGEISSEDCSTFFRRTLLKRLILMGMKPPKGKIETMSEINPHKLGSKPVNFESDRDYLLRKMDDFIICDEKTVKPHPAFGALTKQQWGKIIYTHLDHHLSQFGS